MSWRATLHLGWTWPRTLPLCVLPVWTSGCSLAWLVQTRESKTNKITSDSCGGRLNRQTSIWRQWMNWIPCSDWQTARPVVWCRSLLSCLPLPWRGKEHLMMVTVTLKRHWSITGAATYKWNTQGATAHSKRGFSATHFCVGQRVLLLFSASRAKRLSLSSSARFCSR